LPGTLNLPEIRQALQELGTMTEIEQERERYESRLKAQRDARWLARQPEISLQEGLEKGRAEGLLQGRWIATVQLRQEQLGRPVTPDDELLALPQEVLKRLAEQLTNEASATPKGP
jgi:hypothetical protein